MSSGADSAGVPIKLLFQGEGNVVTVEMKNGEVYRGMLTQAEDTMNCQLTEGKRLLFSVFHFPPFLPFSGLFTSSTPALTSLILCNSKIYSYPACFVVIVTMTARDGRVSRLENVFLRGGQIKFIVLPELLKNSPVLKKVQVMKSKKGESDKQGGMGKNAKKARVG